MLRKPAHNITMLCQPVKKKKIPEKWLGGFFFYLKSILYNSKQRILLGYEWFF